MTRALLTLSCAFASACAAPTGLVGQTKEGAPIIQLRLSISGVYLVKADQDLDRHQPLRPRICRRSWRAWPSAG